MKEKLKKAFTSKHPRSSNFTIIMVITAFIILLTMLFSQQILNYTPLFNSFSENALIVGYAILMASILVAGFTFASLINFKDNAEYYSVKGRKRAFIIECAINLIIVAIVMISIYVVAPAIKAHFFL